MMTLPRRVDGLWILLALVLGWLLLTQQRRAGGAEAQLLVRDSVVQAHAATADSLLAVLQDQRQATAATLAAADVRARRHAARADAAEASAGALAAQLRPALPDPLRAAFDSLEALHASALASKDTLIAEREAQVALLVADTALVNQSLRTMHQVMHEALDQASAWQRKAREPWLRLFWGPGAGVIVSSGTVHAGPGIVVGVQIRP